MMKKFYSILMVAVMTVSWGTVFSQINTLEKCATMHVLEQHKKNDPSLENRMQQAEQNALKWMKSNKTSKKRHEVTIPVVVHVVYNVNDSTTQNIPDSTIQSQIDVLNKDYRRLNADTVNTRPIFDSLAADTYIEFCLAQYDPMGNPTDGITRTATNQTFDPFTNFDGVKSSSTGGKDPWPTDQYLNIWVCDMSFGGQVFVLGYAQFPGDNPATDGVVIQYQHFGTDNDTTAAPADEGRTTVHEVGHWLGLRHIWGDGACDSIDFVYDTPNADAASQSNCDLNKNTCSNDGAFWGGTNPPDMVENYMDYSSDDCMNMFTQGQAERMWSFLFTDRLSLLSSYGCDSTQMNAYTEKQNISCGSACDGWAKVNPFNGGAPYNYLWSPGGQTTDSVGGLCAGNYSVRIIDNGGDTVNVGVNIGTAASLKTATSKVDASCASCADGQASVSHYGGTSPFTYQWDDPGAQISSTATGLNPGWYKVTITDACGKSSVDSVEVLNLANAINEMDQLAGLKVFPNPARSKVQLSWNADYSFTEITIRDISGKKMVNETISSGQNQASVDVSELTAGVYLIGIKSPNRQTVIRKKLIVR